MPKSLAYYVLSFLSSTWGSSQSKCAVFVAFKTFLTLLQINHRKILDGIFEVCGVPPDKIRAISSAVDKLDKVELLLSNHCGRR